MAVPKLRFKDENGADYPEWGKKKLRDITFASGKKNKELGNYESYSINNISGFVSQNEQFEAGNYNNADKSLYYIVSPNSFAYNPARINVGSIGYQELGKDVIVSSLYEVFKTKESCEDKFLWYFLKTKYFNDMIYKYAEGGIRQYLFYDNFCRININIPCLKEQQKIADFLTTFDKRITAQQNIIADMEETKKGLLQKIFSQEIRFKNDNGEDYPDWEKKSWKENVIISTDMVNPKNEEYINLPHVGPGNIESFNGCLLDNILTAKEENLISGKFHFMPGAIIYGKINPQLAKYAHVNFEGLSSADAYVLTATNSLCQNFLFFLLQSKDFFRYSVMVSRRTGMPKINRDELNAFKFMCPSLQEQQKIASFLSAYDKKIEAEKKILADLQEMKKGLLQQMFV